MKAVTTTQLMHIPAAIGDNESHIHFGDAIYRQSLSNNTHTHSHKFNIGGLTNPIEDKTRHSLHAYPKESSDDCVWESIF